MKFLIYVLVFNFHIFNLHPMCFVGLLFSHIGFCCGVLFSDIGFCCTIYNFVPGFGDAWFKFCHHFALILKMLEAFGRTVGVGSKSNSWGYM